MESRHRGAVAREGTADRMKRRTLAQIRERAYAELLINDTVTVYTMLDDYEWRRAGNGQTKIQNTLKQMDAVILQLRDYLRKEV